MSLKVQLDRTKTSIATLWFNRPEARNALDWEAQAAFHFHVRGMIDDPSVRVLILTGVGNQAFCAGGDLVELAQYPSEGDGQRLAEGMGEALNLLEAAPFPTIAAINGYALGGGSEIAVACDMRIIDETARMGFVQLSLGLTPGWGAGQRLARLVGYARAMEILLDARPMTAENILRLGLANRIVAPGQAYTAALEFAERIAGWDMAAVKAVKRLLQNHYRMDYEAALHAERAEFPALWAAEAHRGAVEAFLAERKGK